MQSNSFHKHHTTGTGGVWFSYQHMLPPIVWSVQWLPEFSMALATATNPMGTLHMAKLEMVTMLFN
jgi:hypothetical protein